MTSDRYIVIRVAYDRHPSYGRSLEWIAPELRAAGLTLTGDHCAGLSPSRTWEGFVDGATFQRFADAWGLQHQPHEEPSGRVSEAGDLPMRAYTFDGMNWEIGGESPIIYVSVLVGVANAAYGTQVVDSLAVRARIRERPAWSGWRAW